MLIRGSVTPTEVCEACEQWNRPGIVNVAIDVFGFSWDHDEEALDVLRGNPQAQGVRGRAAEGVARMRRFQAENENRLRCRYVAHDAAQWAMETG